MKRLCLLCFAALIATVATIVFATTTTAHDHNKVRRTDRPIPNRYIIVLNDDAPELRIPNVGELADSLARKHSGIVDHVYRYGLRGFAAEMTADNAEKLAGDGRVKYVEEDSEVETHAVTQPSATWGISRIDHRNFMWPLDQSYTYNATGAGVNIYVIDTGVLTNHPDFEGRATEPYSSTSVPIEQCNGHGTHVAGTIGSRTYGVAKNANLHSVRVFPCYGGTALSNVLAGIDWVTGHAVKPAVANMSMGTVFSSVFGDAVQTLIDSGVTAVVSAGNEGEDACTHSPGHLPDALTVASSNDADARDSLSNYGSCVDIFAPGLNITSTWNRADLLSNTMSGTSSAAPHVAGVAALYLERNRLARPAQVRSAISRTATRGAIHNPGPASPNLLLYSMLPIRNVGAGIPSQAERFGPTRTY